MAEEGLDFFEDNLRLLAMRGVAAVWKPGKAHLWSEWAQRIGLQTGCVLVMRALQDQQRTAHRRQMRFQRQGEQAVGLADAEPRGKDGIYIAVMTREPFAEVGLAPRPSGQ